jgi:hypothetical protein
VIALKLGGAPEPRSTADQDPEMARSIVTVPIGEINW